MSRRTKTEILEGVSDITESKIVARNTVRYKTSNGDTKFRLHRTDVVTLHRNGSVTLNTGGWNTLTTRDRINSYSPFRVGNSKGVLSVHTPVGSFPFGDTITIKKDGNPVGIKKAQARAARVAAWHEKIKAFAKQLKTMESVPLPDAGDCWLCSMFKSTDSDHLVSHVKENYMHGSLIVLAMRERGYQDMGIAMYLNNGNPDKWQRRVLFRNLNAFLVTTIGNAV
jgi:hypothetical protein